MPLYEYSCSNCGEIIEAESSIEDRDVPVTCSACGARADRIISLTNFHLKGGGWAKDGYCPSSGGKKGGG